MSNNKATLRQPHQAITVPIGQLHLVNVKTILILSDTSSFLFYAMFFLWFFIFRPGGTTKTYPEANSSGCWMKSLKVDEKGFKWMKKSQNGWIFGNQNVFLESKFRQK
jgi:hypothetical protein